MAMQSTKPIRSYVLHPHAKVKDARTGIETVDARAVLDGDIDHFLEAALARGHRDGKAMAHARLAAAKR